jgi:hypothetical protein
MSQTLNFIPAFDGTNYGYWKVRMSLFLKFIDVWQIVESGWTKPEATAVEPTAQKSTRLSKVKALNALCQALLPSVFARISNFEFVMTHPQ